jgi:uncharacterized protein (TIGR03086 family)
MAIDESDLRPLDRRAVLASVRVVREVRPADLGRPTPCGDWNVADLLAHMTVQHRGFAAASRGAPADLRAWQPQVAADPVADYLAAAQDVLAAFARDGVLESSFVLPEISATAAVPAALAIGFHFIDYVVHSWDVARSLGNDDLLEAGLPDDGLLVDGLLVDGLLVDGLLVDGLLADDLGPAALRIALAVPDGASRLGVSASFRPGLPVDPGAPVLEQVLHALGRSSTWPDVP